MLATIFFTTQITVVRSHLGDRDSIRRISWENDGNTQPRIQHRGKFTIEKASERLLKKWLCQSVMSWRWRRRYRDLYDYHYRSILYDDRDHATVERCERR